MLGGRSGEDEEKPGAGGADAIGAGVPEGSRVGRGGGGGGGGAPRRGRPRGGAGRPAPPGRPPPPPPPPRPARPPARGRRDVAAYLAATVSSTVAVTEVARRIAIGNVPRLLIGSTAMRRRSTVNPCAASASSMSREVTEP